MTKEEKFPQWKTLMDQLFLKRRSRKPLIPYVLEKAPGKDEITIEILQALDEIGIDTIT